MQISHSANPELAALLQELQSLLATCQLPAADAKEAADTLARVQTEHQGEKNPSRVSRWLAGLEQMLVQAGVGVEIVEKAKTLAGKITALF